MRRKLVQQGKSTLMVSLPAKWCRQQDLQKGDEVELRASGRGIVVSPGSAEGGKAVSVDLAGDIDARVLLTHAYRTGADRILVRTGDDAIRGIVHASLLGMEVTDSKDGITIIEALSVPEDGKLNMVTRRLFLLAQEALTILSDSLVTGSYNVEQMKALRAEHDRFVHFCKRVTLHEDVSSAVTGWELLTWLMHIVHAIDYTYRYTAENSLKADEEVTGILDRLSEYLRLLYEAWEKSDPQRVQRIDEQKHELQFGRLYESIASSSGPRTVLLCHLRELFRLVQISASPVLVRLIQEASAAD